MPMDTFIKKAPCDRALLRSLQKASRKLYNEVRAKAKQLRKELSKIKHARGASRKALEKHHKLASGSIEKTDAKARKLTASIEELARQLNEVKARLRALRGDTSVGARRYFDSLMKKRSVLDAALRKAKAELAALLRKDAARVRALADVDNSVMAPPGLKIPLEIAKERNLLDLKQYLDELARLQRELDACEKEEKQYQALREQLRKKWSDCKTKGWVD